MLTYFLWKSFECDDLPECLICTILSIFTTLLDIIMSPIELIAFMIWKIGLERNANNENNIRRRR